MTNGSTELRQRAELYDRLAQRVRQGTATTRDVTDELLRDVDTSEMSESDREPLRAMRQATPTELPAEQLVQMCETRATQFRDLADMIERRG